MMSARFSKYRLPLGSLWFLIVAGLVMMAPVQVFAEEGGDEAEPAEEAEQAPPAAQPAAPAPKVFLMPTDSVRDEVTQIVTERVGESLRDNMRREGRIELLPTWAQIQRKLEAGQQTSAATAEAERLYTSGIGLLTAGENQRAAETFQRSVDMMEQNIADLHNFEILADALANLSLAYFHAGFDLDARQNMQRFAHLRPKAKLDEEKYPKELRDIFNDEQGRVEKAGDGKLVITANIEGAQVFIDGLPRGETPVTVEDVGFGHHYLVVRDGRGGTWSEQIRVRGRGQEQTFEITLGDGSAPVAEDRASQTGFFTDLREAFKTGEFGEDLAPYLQELATRTGAQYVVWVVLVRDRSASIAHPFVYRVKDGKMASLPEQSFNIELSNLRVGVNSLNDDIIKAILKMPEERIVSAVSLGAPRVVTETPVVVAEAKPPLPVPQAEPRDEGIIAAPAEMPSETKTRAWHYVGWGGAALLVGGAVAGSVYLLTQGDGATKSAGFDAEVQW
ncbi:MAG: PEGA domain-containing protein [Bradymonadaceae bacterium]